VLSFLKKSPPPCSAVIVAAGSARRMGGIDKIMADLGGKPVIYRAIRAFEDCPAIHEIIVVTREDLIGPVSQWCAAWDCKKARMVLCGGSDRLASVSIGCAAVSKKSKLIAVHDGARPLVSQRIISETVAMAGKTGAAAPAIGVKDTVKQAQNGAVTATPDRSSLFAVQTPQIFDADLLRAALKNASDKSLPVTDDCSCVEALGMRVFLTEGEERNLKITTPMDLKIAELWLEGEEA